MGFGIALIGYAFLLLHEIGFGIFAAPVLAYGFFLASRLNGGFLRAAVSSLFILPRGILQFLSVLGILNIDEMPTANTVTFMLFLAAWIFMSYFWLKAVIEISQDCGAEKLERQARNRLVFTVCILVLSAAVGIANIFGLLGIYAYTIAMVQYVLQYAVIFVNLIFLHTCFVLITSEKQYEKDKQQIAIERAQKLKKKHNEQREVSNRFGKRK